MYRRIAMIVDEQIYFIRMNVSSLETPIYKKRQIAPSYTIYYNLKRMIVVRFNEDGNSADIDFDIQERLPSLISEYMPSKETLKEISYTSLKHSLDNVM